MADKFLDLIDGVPTLKTPVASSAGSGDAGKIPKLDANGQLDLTMMPSGVAGDITSCVCSEDLDAGNLVNLWSDSGTLKARKANATDASKPADGFVLAAYTSGDTVTVYHDGIITGLSGLTVGAKQYTSKATSGATTADVSGHTTSGNQIQLVGKARSTSQIVFEPGESVTVA